MDSQYVNGEPSEKVEIDEGGWVLELQCRTKSGYVFRSMSTFDQDGKTSDSYLRIIFDDLERNARKCIEDHNAKFDA